MTQDGHVPIVFIVVSFCVFLASGPVILDVAQTHKWHELSKFCGVLNSTMCDMNPFCAMDENGCHMQRGNEYNVVYFFWKGMFIIYFGSAIMWAVMKEKHLDSWAEFTLCVIACSIPMFVPAVIYSLFQQYFFAVILFSAWILICLVLFLPALIVSLRVRYTWIDEKPVESC